MIGPQIPAHLLKTKRAESESDSERSPSESPESFSQEQDKNGEKCEGRNLPAPAPTIQRQPLAGPALQPHLEQDDDEDEIGPKPLPSGTSYNPHDGVREFIEREKRRQQLTDVSEQCYTSKYG
jgi:hypothetical protein